MSAGANHLPFQSTLPRRERPYLPLCLCQKFLISIHAPAKGATASMLIPLARSKISIHAPAKGATTLELYRWRLRTISIHAPAKGATDKLAKSMAIKYISIHAPAKGATILTSIITLRQNLFQSTLPRRERRQSAHL